MKATLEESGCEHQDILDPYCSQQAELWEAMAEELVHLVAGYLDPSHSRPLSHADYRGEYASSSVGAAHWCQLSRTLSTSAPWSGTALQRNRRCHHETSRCCRVLEYDQSEEDWPLLVLKLRSSKSRDSDSTLLSHATPIARQVLRQAYCSVAREVHPDRVECSLATQAMTVLNEVRAFPLMPHSTPRIPVPSATLRASVAGVSAGAAALR